MHILLHSFPHPLQVSFCTLPPRTHPVPGIEEQRGTHIATALSGAAPFIQPVRCPLPEMFAPQHAQQENLQSAASYTGSGCCESGAEQPGSVLLLVSAKLDPEVRVCVFILEGQT